MRIKRVEIIGFKSFVEKTTISFFDPVTAIVGPNGCGKSNIVDAIRWVMGEQSAKHLRGRAMEDVIFAGSETRGPAGFAEVSLTFDGRGLEGDMAPGGIPWGAIGPEEIVVTRRLFRDGQSDYLLNGVPSRLRDVVDFFLGTGVGSKAYAIIEQGRIGFIVSSRPEERRGLIDEAAGITKYKAKKKAAERRMESTRQHLLRVSDIITEIEGRLRSLRLQAAKAERYKRYKSELKDLDLWSASQRFLGHMAEEKSLLAEIDVLAENHDDRARSLEAEEAAVEIERLSVTDEMNELATAKDDLFALSNKAQLALQRAEHHQDEANGLNARASEERHEIEELTARLVAHAAAISELEGQLVRLEEEATTSGGDYRTKESEHEQLRISLAHARHQLDAALAEVASASARIARNESEQAAATARREDLARRLEVIAGESGSGAVRLEALTVDAGGLRASLGDIGARTGRAWRSQARAGDALRGFAGRRFARRDGAGDVARGGSPSALAVGVAVRDPGSLREFSKGRSRHHAETPGAGGAGRVIRDQGGRRGHRPASARVGDGGRGGVGRAAGQHHRRIARCRGRGHRVPEIAQRGPVQFHSDSVAFIASGRPSRDRRL